MIDDELEALEGRVHRTKRVLSEKTDAMEVAKKDHTEACDALATYKAIVASKLGRLGPAECKLTTRLNGDVDVYVRVVLPWGTLSWNGRLYTSHPAHYVSGRIESTELGDVLAATGKALQEHRDKINTQLAALEKTILDGLKSM